MKDINLIDSCQAHLPVQYALNIEFICKKCHKCCDLQRATPDLLVQNEPLVCSIGCPGQTGCSAFSVLHSNKTVNRITYYIQNCFVS